jgi:hypothetical protein
MTSTDSARVISGKLPSEGVNVKSWVMIWFVMVPQTPIPSACSCGGGSGPVTMSVNNKKGSSPSIIQAMMAAF